MVQNIAQPRFVGDREHLNEALHEFEISAPLPLAHTDLFLPTES